MSAINWCEMFGSVYVNESPLSDDVAVPRPPNELQESAPPLATHEVAPGVFTMASSLGSAMAQFAADGFRVVSRETYRSRLGVCHTCEELSGPQCRACGCFVSAKAWLPAESCPLGKWASSEG